MALARMQVNERIARFLVMQYVEGKDLTKLINGK
jgi:hypothetical protein